MHSKNMLTHLSIHNYLIADHIELDFSRGMTVMTGETGAGKSVILDALALALGGRADRESFNIQGGKIDISACFHIPHSPEVQKWLQDKDLNNQEDCILRRVITSEGRSRGYINGVSLPISDLKFISQQLIDLHGQHGQQLLLNKQFHRTLLDNYGQCQLSAKKTNSLAQQYKTLIEQKKILISQSKILYEREALLRYQLAELEELNLLPNELKELEQLHRQLLHADNHLNICHDVVSICTTNEPNPLIDQISQCKKKLSELNETLPQVGTIIEMLSSAHIQLEEAVTELEHLTSQITADPEQQFSIEKRLDLIYTLARKHHITPEQLIEKQEELREELKKFALNDKQIEQINTEIKKRLDQYKSTAEQLSEKRERAAKKLSNDVTLQLKRLNMPHSQFLVSLTPNTSNTPSAQGLESIEFLISTNLNQPPKTLAKVASGGELSRISLAIQVITAQTSHTNTIIFDEIDVGISGKTAETVGNMLQKIGHTTQIVCITHQPQVAAKGHHHIHITKNISDLKTQIAMTYLSHDERTQEIARMLAGAKITTPSLAHAKEMLSKKPKPLSQEPQLETN